MRIISGQLRGRRLKSLRGSMVRPTADQVREALFNILADHASEACVLDLFAGTGALGIEALSRGARQAVFVDNGGRPLRVLRSNLHHCGLIDRSRVIRWDISKNLNCLKIFHACFNLVFMDPPYHKQLVGMTLSHLLRVPCLAPGAMIIAEHERHAQLASPDTRMILADRRQYGQTALSFFHFDPGGGRRVP
jgi:16S rRNA (guanine966-N2)-methyltransferase